MNKLKKLISANKGFTLIELLLAITILSVFLTMIVPMIIHPFIVGQSFQRMSTQQMAELNLRKISRYVRNAVEVDFNENKITIQDETIIENENNDIIKNDKILISNTNFELEAINVNDKNIYKITIQKCDGEDLEKCEEDDLIKISTNVQIRN
ncbi:MAG: type II secretion system protein [bacterium]